MQFKIYSCSSSNISSILNTLHFEGIVVLNDSQTTANLFYHNFLKTALPTNFIFTAIQHQIEGYVCCIHNDNQFTLNNVKQTIQNTNFATYF